MPTPESEPTYAGDDDVGDAMGIEELRGGFDAHMDFNGFRLSKTKALRLAMAGLTRPRASTDRTKRVASIPCYQDSGIYDDQPQILDTTRPSRDKQSGANRRHADREPCWRGATSCLMRDAPLILSRYWKGN
ncbi:hypothetical protein B0H13DRAFT_1917587 [Mycena leptocephala]|nr:hypothetical protein B0H13DRAFT_1917587 [Mycena leptocephala]